MNSSETSPSNENQWYYADHQNEAVGPVSFDELKRLAAEGVIQNGTYVIPGGGAEWKPFSDLMLPPLPPMTTKAAGTAKPRGQTFPKRSKIIAAFAFSLFGICLVAFHYYFGSPHGKANKVPHSHGKANNVPPSLSDQPTEADFGVVVSSAEQYVRFGGNRYNFPMMITALYDGKLTISDVQQCVFAPGSLNGRFPFRNVVGDYLICATPNGDAFGDNDSTLEFALRRNRAIEENDFKKNCPERLKYGPGLCSAYLAWKDTSIVGMGEFTTQDGVVKQIPVFEAFDPPKKENGGQPKDPAAQNKNKGGNDSSSASKFSEGEQVFVKDGAPLFLNEDLRREFSKSIRNHDDARERQLAVEVRADSVPAGVSGMVRIIEADQEDGFYKIEGQNKDGSMLRRWALESDLMRDPDSSQ